MAFVAKEDQPRDGRRIPTAVLAKGMELLLFRRKRPDEDFYHIPGHFGAVGRGANTYIGGDLEAERSEARVACKVMADPQRALKSKSEDDRMLAADMLATRYRTHPIGMPPGKAVREEVGRKRAGRSWTACSCWPGGRRGTSTRPCTANLSKADGFEGLFAAEKARDWVRASAGTYRIKRFVPGKDWIRDRVGRSPPGRRPG